MANKEPIPKTETSGRTALAGLVFAGVAALSVPLGLSAPVPVPDADPVPVPVPEPESLGVLEPVPDVVLVLVPATPPATTLGATLAVASLAPLVYSSRVRVALAPGLEDILAPMRCRGRFKRSLLGVDDHNHSILAMLALRAV